MNAADDECVGGVIRTGEIRDGWRSDSSAKGEGAFPDGILEVGTRKTDESWHAIVQPMPFYLVGVSRYGTCDVLMGGLHVSREISNGPYRAR